MAKFTSEFKTVVAKRAMKAQTYSEVSREYGVSIKVIKKWTEEYEKYGELAFTENGHDRFNEQRIRELEIQIKDLEEDNEILKKAAAVFSKYPK